MARIRTIKPSFWTDEKVLAMSIEAGFVLLGMISHADDEGYITADATTLRAEILGGRGTPRDMHRWLAEIEESEVVEPLRISNRPGGRFYRFPNWHRHQNICRPAPSAIEARLQEFKTTGANPREAPNVDYRDLGAVYRRLFPNRRLRQSGAMVLLGLARAGSYDPRYLLAVASNHHARDPISYIRKLTAPDNPNRLQLPDDESRRQLTWQWWADRNERSAPMQPGTPESLGAILGRTGSGT